MYFPTDPRNLAGKRPPIAPDILDEGDPVALARLVVLHPLRMMHEDFTVIIRAQKNPKPLCEIQDLIVPVCLSSLRRSSQFARMGFCASAAFKSAISTRNVSSGSSMWRR